MPIQNLVGDVYGELTVLSLAHKHPTLGPHWFCKCSCGKTVTVRGNSMRQGLTKSCGCWKVKMLTERMTRHGFSSRKGDGQHPMYAIWLSMRQRCSDPSNVSYRNYGGRGITVCDRWQVFDNFKDDMLAGWKKGLSVERINNNQGYSPENCKWASPMEQAHNRRNNVRITFQGKTLTLSEWSVITGIPPNTLAYRKKCGLDDEHILTDPIVYKKVIRVSRPSKLTLLTPSNHPA